MIKTFLRTIIFFLVEALRSIRTNKVLTGLTVGTISAAMAFMGFFFLIFVNMEEIFLALQNRTEMIVYVSNSAAGKDISTLRSRLTKSNKIEEVAFISRKDALKAFKKSFASEKQLLESLDDNPLPASFVIRLSEKFQSPEKMHDISLELSKEVAVEEIEYGKEWVERLDALFSFMRLGLTISGGLLMAGLLFITSNTIRLSIYSRNDEIDIMKLVGASPRYIKGPFICEGMLHGLVGTFFSLIFLYLCHLVMNHNISSSIKVLFGFREILFLPLSVIVEMLLAGVVLGFFAASISLRNLMKIRE